MKAIAFGVAFAGTVIGYGIAAIRRDLTRDENASCCLCLLVLFLGVVLS